MRRTVSSSVIFFVLAFALAACGSRGGGGGGEVSVNGLDGASDVAVDSVFKYTFSQGVNISTVTNETFFIVESDDASASVLKGSFDPTLCDNTQAIDAIVSCLSTTVCTLDPAASLDSFRRYYACLSPDIRYLGGGFFEGFMATFMTAASTFTVGGTVAGLGTGEEVVLQNNGGDDLTITADGAFTFATGLGDGDAYAVTVLTAPEFKTCSVGNGTGTISGANVTNVSVVCSANAFKVGGTVSGLMGTVVLQNNGGDDLTISANGPFTFATEVADGGAYAVTVKTQPASPSQICTVGNGSGMIAGADVTNVSVICSTSSYTIGGTVAGLAGTGLVLQNNGGDDLPIAADGPFTFATKVASGANYDVTLKTQPTNPSQTCIVTNGTGTVTNANVTNVNIDCTTNTYTIGGDVSGLAGSGLVLQNNAGDDLPIAADGPFTFSTPVASGADYSVTVMTQPTNLSQTCDVTSGGSGTVTNANVTDVSVVCTTNSFTIGGGVSGLDDTGTVVLQNNGGDDRTIDADGPFEFAGTIQDGSPYDVTVLTDPLTQHCNVTNGSGTVNGANVTDVDVDCDYEDVIFSTTTASFTGNLGGIAGADALCDSAANKPDSRTYRALIVDGNDRVACTTAFCSGGPGEHVNWVLSASTSYYRPGLAVDIGTTNANGIFDFPLENGFVADSTLMWTGLTVDWLSTNNCVNWTSNSFLDLGVYGASGDTSDHAISVGNAGCQIDYANLICVSPPTL